MDPIVYFITPVHERYALTAICLEQRKRMLAELPFEAHAVVIGDDDNMTVAEKLGLHTVTRKNDYVGAKFNEGYRYAVDNGATHVMAIGSDSWLHPGVFEHAAWDKKAIGLIGLSSFSAYGDERLDLGVKYPAGFGVGMVYPAHCLTREPCEPSRQYGCDTSTWSRCGRNRIGIEFLDLKPYTYLNFHSPDVQITDYKALKRAFNRVIHRETEDALGCLEGRYDEDLIDRLREVYAVRSVGAFVTGAIQEPPPRHSKPKQSRRWLPPAEARRIRERAIKREIQLHGESTTADRFRAVMGRP